MSLRAASTSSFFSANPVQGLSLPSSLLAFYLHPLIRSRQTTAVYNMTTAVPGPPSASPHAHLVSCVHLRSGQLHKALAAHSCSLACALDREVKDALLVHIAALPVHGLLTNRHVRAGDSSWSNYPDVLSKHDAPCQHS